MNKKKYSFSTWLKYIETFNIKNRKNLLDLKFIAKKLGLLNLKSFVFTVGGTNGKGTTCAVLEKFFLNSNYQVGLYTSPHLINYVERIKINGFTLSEDQHIDSFINIDRIKGSIELTYFEFVTLSALFLFKQYMLDIIILEVGIGGRLDATNIIDSNLSVITNIGIDHIALLGSDRTSIGYEKSGIFRKGKIAVIGEKNLPPSVNKVAKDKKVLLKKINIDWFWKKHSYGWDFFCANVQWCNFPFSKIPLSNAAISVAALYYSGFNININHLKDSIYKTYVPGRFQVISNFPRIIIDVAHNINASLYLSKKMNKIDIHGKLYSIIGVLKDKDISGIINPLVKKICCWYASTLQTTRSMSIAELKNHLPKEKTLFFCNIRDAWENLKKILKKEDTVLVFGSFITVSEFIFVIHKDQNIIVD